VAACKRAIICFVLIIGDPVVVKMPYFFFNIWLLEWMILYVYFESV
jgi:hypothetical protein